MKTSKQIADDLGHQHTFIKSYIKRQVEDVDTFLFPVEPPKGSYGSLESKYPRWCYKLSDKQAMFIELSLSKSLFCQYLLTGKTDYTFTSKQHRNRKVTSKTPRQKKEI